MNLLAFSSPACAKRGLAYRLDDSIICWHDLFPTKGPQLRVYSIYDINNNLIRQFRVFELMRSERIWSTKTQASLKRYTVSRNWRNP